MATKSKQETLDISRVIFKPTQPLTITNIVYEYIGGSTNDAPAYQRPDNSSLHWKRELVRSVLVGFPIPSLYFRQIIKHPTFFTEIVDGGHRVRVLALFYRNELKTPNGCFVTLHPNPLDEKAEIYDISNMTHKQISDKHGKPFIERIFGQRHLSVNYVEGEDVYIANVFKLVNNGNDLSKQEERQSSYAVIAKEIRNITHQSIDKRGNIIPGWHRVFDVTDFKIGRWDYGHVTAQCSQYELNTDKPNLTSDALDALYLDNNYADEFPIIKRVNKIYNKMIPVLQHRGLTYKKGFFVNLYMFMSFLDSNKYKIVDHSKFMKKYEVDEETRRDTKPMGVAKSPYNNATKEYTWKFVIERLDYILSDFLNATLDEYGIIELDSKRTYPKRLKRIRYNQVGGKCEKCNANITFDVSEADHNCAHTNGGKTDYHNLRILCRSCNRQKSSKPEMELV